MAYSQGQLAHTRCPATCTRRWSLSRRWCDPQARQGAPLARVEVLEHLFRTLSDDATFRLVNVSLRHASKFLNISFAPCPS